MCIRDRCTGCGPYRKAWILRLQSFLGRKLAVIVYRLWALQKSLDSEASELPGQKVNGNCVQAVGPTEKLRF